LSRQSIERQQKEQECSKKLHEKAVVVKKCWSLGHFVINDPNDELASKIQKFERNALLKSKEFASAQQSVAHILQI